MPNIAFDNLTPYNDNKSRNEVMLIEYDNVLVNTNYCILKHLRANIDKYKEFCKDGELLTAITGDISNHDIYEYGKLMTHNDCMKNIFKDPKSESVMKILKEVNYNLHDYSYFLANGISKILESEKTKKIFVSISHFNSPTQTDSIIDIFNTSKSMDKLTILDIGPYECLKKTLGFTTIMLSDVEDLFLISLNKKMKFKSTQFILMDKISNKDYKDVAFDNPNDPEDKIVLPININEYRHEKELDIFQKKYESSIVIMDQYYSDYY